MFDLGEGLLDGVEVRRVGRQEPEPGAGGFDDLTQSGGLMAVAADLARRHRSRPALALRPLHHRGQQRRTVAPPSGNSSRRPPLQPRAPEDRSKGLLPSDAGLRPASILNLTR